METLELLAGLKERQALMIEQLHAFCTINSGTENLPGLASMHSAISKAFLPIADSLDTCFFPPIETINMRGEKIKQDIAPALLIRKRAKLPQRILLSGHMDTVYPANSSFQNLTYLSSNKLRGPGVSDMKGGIVVMLEALKAFEQTKEAQYLGWDVFISTDEEIGSPASSVFFKELAPAYKTALVYEPALNIEGLFAKNRKGSGKLSLIAQGRAAHAGRAFAEGRNAIAYLAEAIIAIHGLNGQKEGVSINIGKVAGGEALNVVPDKALAMLDVRITSAKDEAWVMEKLQGILTNLERADYQLSLNGRFDRPVKTVSPASLALFEQLKTLGKELNLDLQWQDCGGCCDGNNFSQLGLAVIDSLGVRGGCIHSPDEFILLDSLVERAALSALLLRELAKTEAYSL